MKLQKEDNLQPINLKSIGTHRDGFWGGVPCGSLTDLNLTLEILNMGNFFRSDSTADQRPKNATTLSFMVEKEASLQLLTLRINI